LKKINHFDMLLVSETQPMVFEIIFDSNRKNYFVIQKFCNMGISSLRLLVYRDVFCYSAISSLQNHESFCILFQMHLLEKMHSYI